MLQMFSTPVNEEFMKKDASDTSKATTPEPQAQADQVQVVSKQNDKLEEQQVNASADTQAEKPASPPKDKSGKKTVSKKTDTKSKAAPKAKTQAAPKVKTQAAAQAKTKTQAKQADKKGAKPAAKKTVKASAKKDSKKPQDGTTSASDNQNGKDELWSNGSLDFFLSFSYFIASTVCDWVNNE